MPESPPSIDIVEALLFASEAPVEAQRIQEVLDLPSAGAARELLDRLRERLDEDRRLLQILEVGGGFRLVTRPEAAPWLVKLARSKTKSRLSRPALETLAIVAYRQPVSRPEVDTVRGVNSEAVLDNLLDRRMIRIAGRKESPGRPFLYETTRDFLVTFGLRDLGDLPKVEGELLGVEPRPGAGRATTAPESPRNGEEDVALTSPEAGSPDTSPAKESAAATDSPQQAPGSSGPDLTPRS